MFPAAVRGVRATMVTLAGGTRLRVVESGAPAGAPVLMIHGWGASVYTFRYALEALARAGRRALACDLRGHGLSDKPIGREAYSTSALLDDVRGVLDALDVERADLVGHSLGGGISLRFAVAHPERVRRLVLAAPVGLTRPRFREIAHLLTPGFTNHFARYLPPRWLTMLLLRAAYADPRRLSERSVDEYWAPSQFPEYYMAVRSLLDRFTWEPLTPSELATIRARTLVILGSEDRLIRGAEERARRIPNAVTFSLEGAGHLGIEECANEFNDELVPFLSDERSP